MKPVEEFRADRALSLVGIRKCGAASDSFDSTQRADDDRVTKAELESALKRAGLDGHRDGSRAAFVIGVAVSTLHGWRNKLAADRLPTRRAIERLDHVAEMRGNVVEFRKVVGLK